MQITSPWRQAEEDGKAGEEEEADGLARLEDILEPLGLVGPHVEVLAVADLSALLMRRFHR